MYFVLTNPKIIASFFNFGESVIILLIPNLIENRFSL